METLKQEPADVDMDAPQISTLRQEDSPPPAPRRVKLLLNNDKPGSRSASTSSRKRPLSDHEDEEDEEDQLADDDDTGLVVPPAPPLQVLPSPAVEPAAPSKPRKAPAKRKPRKSEKKLAEEEAATAEKTMQSSAPGMAPPTMSWFEVNASKASENAGRTSSFDVQVPVNIVAVDPGSSKPPPKKKPRKTPTTSTTTSAPKPRTKSGPKLKQVEDTTDVVSEAGFTATAASSPITAAFEPNGSPEPEPILPLSIALPVEDAPIILADTPLPQYPLPVKPFSVLPPQKMNSGFAPIIPLDRSGAPVRRWRTVNREIRGIAGGRWFTRAWVGAKESSAFGGEKSVVASASPSPAKPAKVRAVTKTASTSNAASRSSSTVPSKMRNIVAESVAGDDVVVMA